jgi:putative FmdB family regulatory protein
MPTYEYRCEKCGHTFEVMQSMSAPVLKICPEDLCARKKWGRGAVAKQIGAGAGLLFKGSGFYLTDYRSEGYKQAAKKDQAKPDSKPATPKTEAKPAPTPAAKAEKK